MADSDIRSAWAERNVKLRDDATVSAAEHYPAGDTAELAQLLYDSGLLYEINRVVLHGRGLALGVAADHETKQAQGLFIRQTDDPDGFVFDDEDHAIGRAKLEKAGMLNGARP